jgi:broad specificity phosphatase PhoE
MHFPRCVARFAGLLLAAALAIPGAAASDELWTSLGQGGRVILLRHAITTPGVGDPPGMRLDDCATQRNLTDAGRAHARAIGSAFRSRRLEPERVLSSPWCRCIETAELAFGRAEVSTPLSNLFGRSANADRQVDAMRGLIAAHHGKGNLVLVTHGSTVVALTGVSPDTGEMVIVVPQPGGKFAVEGRLTVENR